jgi:putative ABC transport system permease protein
LGTTRVLGNLLFHIAPYDPGSLAVSLMLLAAVALAATLIPAHRAMKTDPMVALRCE